MSCRECSNHRWQIAEGQRDVERLARVAVRSERNMDIAGLKRMKARLRQYRDNFTRHQQAEHTD